MLKTRIPQLCLPCQDGPRKQRTNAQNLLNHQSQHQTQECRREVSQQELQWCFSQWLEMACLPRWPGHPVPSEPRWAGQVPIGPAWTSHEMYFCVANEGTKPRQPTKPQIGYAQLPQKADLSCRSETSWKGQCGAGKGCVCRPEQGSGKGAAAQVCGDRTVC